MNWVTQLRLSWPFSLLESKRLPLTEVVSEEDDEIPLKAVSGSAIEVPMDAVSDAGTFDAAPSGIVFRSHNSDGECYGSALFVPIEAATGSAIQYTYDAFNRLTEYSSGDISVEYSYNAEDYRVGKRVVDTNGVEVIQYFYEGDHVLFETDGIGSITAYNLYGNHLISRSVQGERYYYLYNAHGDVVMLMDVDSGAVAATHRYDAFGNLLQQTGYADNNITYAGYQYDEETGLYYLNARYYNSNTGRFLTEDTYRGRQQDPLSLHRYTYCHNNPLIYWDPTGHNAALIEAEFGWVRDVDGSYPYFDMLYFVVVGLAFLATKIVGEPYSGPSPETVLYPAPCPAPQPAPQNNISINTDGNIGTMVDPVYDGMRSRILWFPIENARTHILETPQYNDEPIWVLKDPVIENSGPQIMVDLIPYDTSIHIYQSNKGADKSNGGDTGNGAYQSGRKSPNGLIGHDFEDYLTKNIGGEGSFSVGGRDFDGRIGNRWWEAKSGQYWDMLENNSSKLEKFKSDMGACLKIATDNGASYELFSNTPIPSSIKELPTNTCHKLT